MDIIKIKRLFLFLFLITMGSLGSGCANIYTSYSNSLVKVSQVKITVISRLRLFDCQHQLQLTMDTPKEKLKEIIEKYRAKRAEIEQYILESQLQESQIHTKAQKATTNEEVKTFSLELEALSKALEDKLMQFIKEQNNQRTVIEIKTPTI